MEKKKLAARQLKLKVTDWSYGSADVTIRSLEEAKDFLNFDLNTIVKVEGQVLVAYDELLRLIEKEEYRDSELLEIEIIPLLSGG